MLIDVVVSGWEQECCGPAFVRGELSTVKVAAANPDSLGTGALPRFVEEHHGQTPDDVPHWEVSGTVAQITGVNYESRRRPGPVPFFETGPAVTSSGSLDRVDARSAGGFGGLVLQLEVADGIALPSFVDSREAIAQREKQRLTAEREGASLRDPVGLLLESLADDAQETFADCASFFRSSERSALLIEPSADGAASITWTRYVTDVDDWIEVAVGEGRWVFASDVEHAADLRRILECVAAGRVQEKVHVDGESTQLETVVHDGDDDGRRWSTSITVTSLSTSSGMVMMGGGDMRRIQAGDHGYEPWASGI